jgi:alkyldihydroxyacetonephosphate synthase
MDDPPRTELSWSGWGDPAQAMELPAKLLEQLRTGLGVGDPTPPPATIAELQLAGFGLAAANAAALAEIVGVDNARSDHESRARHALGKSASDMLAIRSARAIPAPDLVLLPGSHAEVLGLLERCSARHVAVVPFGGGTSVVGGVTPAPDGFDGLVALDLRRLNRLVAVDDLSRIATLGPGLRGPEAELLLSERGYTIGHFPQSFEYATLGGFAAARSSGQASAGYGRFDELVVGLDVATPVGTLSLGRAPKSAAGPDLRQLILGSEGALGVITQLTVQVRPVPAARVYEGWLTSDFDSGVEILRQLAQDGPRPTVMRLSDEAETALGLARPGELGQAAGAGCLAIVGYEGAEADVERRRAGAARVLEAAGATLVPGAGDGWARDRYRGPYLRDALIDAGLLVETLETVTFWSSVRQLYAAVAAAVRKLLTEQGTPPVILCHVSHVYPSGASLYFTVACAQLPDPIEQWRQVKTVANNAIIDTGGSISHHHGIGRDHRQWLEREIGQLGVGVLTAVKQRLDPAGILNPGILIAG